MELVRGSGRFRVLRSSSQKKDLVNEAVSASTKHKKKQALNMFAELMTEIKKR